MKHDQEQLYDFAMAGDAVLDAEDIRNKSLPELLDLLRMWEPRFALWSELELYADAIGADTAIPGDILTAVEIYRRSGKGKQESKLMRQFCIARIYKMMHALMAEALELEKKQKSQTP